MDQLTNQQYLASSPWATDKAVAGGTHAQIENMKSLMPNFIEKEKTKKRVIDPETRAIEAVIVFRDAARRGPGTHERVEIQGPSSLFAIDAARIAYQEGSLVNAQVIVPLHAEMSAPLLEDSMVKSMLNKKVMCLVDEKLLKDQKEKLPLPKKRFVKKRCYKK